MRFVNAHAARDIVDKLPSSYFEGKDRAAEEAKIGKKLGSCARGDYRFTRDGVALVIEVIRSAPFDSSEEGEFRARAKTAEIDIDSLYTNEFVARAMESIA